MQRVRNAVGVQLDTWPLSQTEISFITFWLPNCGANTLPSMLVRCVGEPKALLKTTTTPPPGQRAKYVAIKRCKEKYVKEMF